MDPDEVIAAQRVGSSVGDWKLERVLGVGGMASVFAARRADGRAAAVKLLHAYLHGIDEIEKRFLREGPIGQALAAVGPKCAGLPQIWESGVTPEGTAYLVMEILDGETVFDRLARVGVMPVDHVLWIAQQVLEVLVLAHGHGVVHRDLKPENLLVTHGGQVKVLDFGIARVLQDLPNQASLPEKTRTRTGTAMGSSWYMAPEQAIGNISAIDGRTDLFSLGATMYHLLAGRPIHGDLFDANLLIATATAQAAPLASVAPDVDAHVCAVVDRAIAFKGAERYPDASIMKVDVYSLRSGREPPYAAAVLAGKIRPGERLRAR